VTAPPPASAVLEVLADLSPSARSRPSALAVPRDWFRWLPASGVRLFQPAIGRYPDPRTREARSVTIERATAERLAALDRVRPGEQHSLRAGWLFVAGRRPLDGRRTQRVLHPLLSVPVRIVFPLLFGEAYLTAAGDVAVSGLIDPVRRHELEAGYEVGGGALDDVDEVEIPAALLQRLERLRSFAAAAAAAAGFDATDLVPATTGPDELLSVKGLTIVAGVALFTAGEAGGLSAAAALRSWASRPVAAATAFSALYLGSPGAAEPDPVGGPAPRVLAPFPLTPTQKEAVSVSREASVSVVSGAAGTGKSHTVSAIACDAVGRGESVLVAAKTDAAVDALLVLLGEAPGLDPVVFGSSERREELAARLASGELRAAGRAELAEAERSVDEAVGARDELVAWVIGRLEAEARFSGDGRPEERARLVGPGLFDLACDLSEVSRLLDVASRRGGWWTRRRARKAGSQALALAAAGLDTPPSALRVAVDVASQSRAVADLVAGGGLDLTAEWRGLADLEERVQRCVAEWLVLAGRSPARFARADLAAVAVLGTALRSGRAARREQLARLDGRLTRALPLWVGTLGDVEDLLPPTPALFDLVILDEASAIDQPLAAPALLRGRRTVVVGDPHQLRHVSFLADDQLRRAAEDHGLEDPVLIGRLDVRRNSIFDVAVGSAPATILEEHFRSAPHLIDFVARRLYGGRLLVATRSPRTESRDCIDVVRMSGRRDSEGVVRSEVEEVVTRLSQMLRAGVRSVGVISPFRAQADALEEAVLGAFSLQDLDALDLRVGTVHAFQGNERDVVVVSLGIGEDDGAGSWRFAEDPHLFAVLATRARHRVVLLLSAPPPAEGLLADYLDQADAPPGRPTPAGACGRWAASVGDWLASAGVPALPGYPTGRHHVDVCAGDGERFLGLECAVHPDGPAAHVERHLALRRAGWDLADAYPSRWQERQGELVVNLTRRLGFVPRP